MEKGSVSNRGPILKGVAVGLAAGTLVLLLFGLVGKSWLVGILAGVCCAIGFFCMAFAWFYLKAVERFYQEHPELQAKPREEPEQGKSSEE